ncbi:MAG: DMT family transporter, partial [Paraclostridium sp.]
MNDKMEQRSKGYILVITAGILWSTLGLFANTLLDKGVRPEQLAFIRLFLGFLILFVYSLVKMPKVLKISKKTFIYCLMIGVISQAGFNLCYFNSINHVGVSAAAVLLYTSPLFLAFLSKLVYKEQLNKNKIISLIVCFTGSILAITGGSLEMGKLNTVGIIVGILAAITYACMSIISKTALKECEGITLLIYGFLIGAILMTPLAKPWELGRYISDFSVIGLGVVPAAGAYICYIEGISKGIELSIAGILASGELVGSAIIGWTLLGEEFSTVKLI